MSRREVERRVDCVDDIEEDEDESDDVEEMSAV